MSIDISAMGELREAADRASQGIRDPEAIRRACERMDRSRGAIGARIGVLNVATDLIRETRSD